MSDFKLNLIKLAIVFATTAVNYLTMFRILSGDSVSMLHASLTCICAFLVQFVCGYYMGKFFQSLFIEKRLEQALGDDDGEWQMSWVNKPDWVSEMQLPRDEDQGMQVTPVQSYGIRTVEHPMCRCVIDPQTVNPEPTKDKPYKWSAGDPVWPC